VGTMLAMLLVGRLSGKLDPRLMIMAGLGLTALSLWEMSRFTLMVDAWSIVRTGITQGLGLGFIFVPLSTITFATLRPQWRNEGTAMFSLMRNIGSSIGISVMVTLLARNTQANHALLSDGLTLFNSALQAAGNAWDPGTLAGALALNSEVTRQAAAIAYLADFRAMMWVTLLATPLLALLREPGRPAGVTDTAAAAGDG
jgi:DHA2 family multidrug resistance protein